jgi:probable O-glycosylation ligase (exosortase A-associated)
MRDALLMALVAVLCLVAVFSPRYGLLGYLWYSLFRPDILAFSTGRPYSMLLAVVTLASSLRAAPRAIELIGNPFVLTFLGYQAWSGLSVLTAQRTALCFPNYTYFVTFSVIVLLIPILIRTRDDLRVLLLVLGGSIGLLGAKMGIYGILAGGVVFVQGYGGMLNDNNLVALALVTACPLLWYAIRLVTFMPLKLFYGISLFTTLAAIAMCHSRGGILSLSIVMTIMAWRSKHRVLAFVVMGILALPGAWLVRDSLFNRMSTLSHYQDDESAAGRLAFWRAAIRVSLDYPVFGVGFGGDNYRQVAGSYLNQTFTHSNLVVHNTYLQILADSGYPTLMLYLGLLFGSIYWMRKLARRIKASDPEMSGWCDAVWIALFGYSIGSVFLSRAIYDFPYMLMLTVAAVYQLHATGVLTAPAEQPAGTASLEPVLAPSGLLPADPADEPAWKRPGAGRRLRFRQRI